MKEIMGGCWFAGLIVWALLGFVPGLILLVIGAIAGIGELHREWQLERAEASWRKTYPPYRY